MKLAILLCTMLLLLAGVASAQTNTLVGQGTSLTGELLRYEPNPAEAGDIITIYIVLSNNGSEAARGVVLELVENYPFSATETSEVQKEFSSIPGQQSAVSNFLVHVDKDAPEGTNYFKIRYKPGSATGWKESLIPVDIATNDASIAITHISTEPKELSPGKPASITLDLKNLADSRLRDIAVKLNTEITVGSTTTALPITPLGDSLEQRVDELLAEESKQFKFDIIVDPDAESNVYKIPITITFSDERGNDFTYNDQVGIIINAEAKLDVYLDSLDIYKDKKSGSLTLKFVNRGLSEVKLLNIELLPTENYQLIKGADHIYIGNINSDDFDTQSISIQAKEDTLEMPLRVSYLDSLNNENIMQITLSRDLVSSKINGESNNYFWLIVLVAVLGVGYWWYKRKKRNTKRR